MRNILTEPMATLDDRLAYVSQQSLKSLFFGLQDLINSDGRGWTNAVLNDVIRRQAKVQKALGRKFKHTPAVREQLHREISKRHSKRFF